MQKRNKANLWFLLKPYARLNVWMLFLALLASGANLVLPKIISRAIDDISHGSTHLRDLSVIFLCVSIFIALFTWLQSIVQTYTSEQVARNLRRDLSDKLLRQSFSSVYRSDKAKLLSVMTSDVDSVKMFVSQALVAIVSSFFLIIGVLSVLFSINVQLTFVVLLILPVIIIFFVLIMRRAKPQFRLARNAIDRLNNVINQNIVGSMLIRILNSQQSECDKFLRANANSRDVGLAIVKLFATIVPLISFIGDATVFVAVLMGGRFVIDGGMTIGDFAAYNSYLSILFFPIMVIGFTSNAIAQTSVSYQRIHDVLDTPEEKEEGTLVKSIKGDIDVKNVSLTYDGIPILKDISLDIHAGSKVAILGPTAAGKTQLLYLFSGLIPPTGGTINYDNIPVAAYDLDSFHHQVGIVFQDSIIFNLSIRENIAFSHTVSDEALRTAIDSAELNDFISGLPQGLDTLISERGNNLSGGQKQRIMLARTLAMRPKVLLLDDFTARVDNETERNILKNLAVNYPEMTVISITQKISSIIHFDKIILMMEGEVISIGTHNELLESCTEYMQIYQSQKSTQGYEV